MKQILLVCATLSLPSIATAQVFWTEDFGTGCSQGQLAAAYTSSNGLWTVSNSGANGSYANTWYVSATAAGTGVNNCVGDCGSSTNRTLHISNVADSECGCFWGCSSGDCGAKYDACAPGSGFTLCNPSSVSVEADRRAESPVIDCSGQTGITLWFSYLHAGQSGIDYASLWYFDGSAWSQLATPGASNNSGCGLGGGQWTAFSMALPASANNNPNVKLGFRWINNQDDVGTDPSFAVDDIMLSVSSPCSSYSVSIAAQTDVSCHGGSDGTATAAASYGTSPYAYAWSNSQSSPTASGLVAGTYSVTITDNNGCIDSAVVTINQPDSLSLTFSTVDANCGVSDGSATVAVTGGTPGYGFLWSNGATTTMNGSLGAGTYSVTVTDTNGCTRTANITVNNLNAPTLNIDEVTDVTCFGYSDGSIAAGASGGNSPYEYSIDGVNFQQSGLFSGLAAASYIVHVRDASGCVSSVVVNVGTPPALTVDAGSSQTITPPQTAQLIATSNDAGASFVWIPAGDLSCANCPDPIASPSTHTTFTVTATDANGCVATDTVSVFVLSPVTVGIPNAFTPIADGVNDLFDVHLMGANGFTITIYNRWGQVIFSSNSPSEMWDGTFNGMQQAVGVYAYLINALASDGTALRYTGNVTLLR